MNFVFFSTFFITPEARAGGKRAESHVGPRGRPPEEKPAPEGQGRGSGDARGRIAGYLIGIARAPRGRL